MKKNNLITIFFSLLFLICGCYVKAQENTYVVTLKDKNNNSYSINNPEAFLSPKAIDRRVKHHISIDEYDLPISPYYKAKIIEKGYKIIYSLKWINTLIVTGFSDEGLLTLPFVEKVKWIYRYQKDEPIMSHEKPFFDAEYYQQSNVSKSHKKSDNKYDYGDAENQIVMLKGNVLHNAGYDGEGMTIGVLDAGFGKVKELGVFKKMINEGRLLGSKDIVEGLDLLDNSIHYHGQFVLSCMAANEEGLMVGTAPKANYWLIRTEDARKEYLLEEYFWIDGAEFADSVGVDIINSSLGYNKGFETPENDHVYADMDGKTTIVSIGAGIASDRGILVVNSAGNSGDKPWKFITAPADNESVLTVGGVNKQGEYAYFSSIGPTADGRIKPDVVAQAEAATLISSDNTTFEGNGTSFSSPIMAGISACLWQMLPEKNNREIKAIIKQYANLSDNPNDYLGYGIPDFQKIHEGFDNDDFTKEISIYPNPFTSRLTINLGNRVNHINIELYNVKGSQVLKKEFNHIEVLNLSILSELSAGVYFLKITSKHKTITKKVIKWQ